MRPPTPINKSRISELEKFRKTNWPGLELQRFLCVWLRVKRGLTTKEIADTLGWHVNTVRHIQKDFADHGASALTDRRKGARIPQNMTPEEEALLLDRFKAKAGESLMVVASKVRVLLEKHLGRRVHLSTAYRLLKRHGWRKAVPSPKHPIQDT